MAPKVISFHYTLTNKAGETLDSSQGGDPFSFIEGMGQIIPGLENALSALKDGDTKVILVPAADAYGERDASNHHPLAGEDLTFDVKLVASREATAEEISHGHAHGEHGHSH